MNNQHRIEKIQQVLQSNLNPSQLEVIDDSHLHAGHAGATSGKGHFTVIISSDQFSGLTSLQRHKLIYSALGDLMQTDIHALTIRASVAA